jgi:hypothetical protein
MQRYTRGDIVLAGLIVVAVIVYAAQSLRKKSSEVNPHDPNVARIEAFELQPGEVGVVVRVRHGQQPAPATTVWASRDDSDDDTGPASLRKGATDAGGLVKVPIHKGGLGQVRLFARDETGRVGGGALHPGQLLSAPDIVLVEVAARSGRLVSTSGQPIAGATLIPESFSTRQPPVDGAATYIDIPEAIEPQYTVKTDAAGRFMFPAIPVGFLCRLAFTTDGYGEGHILLPDGSSGECRLAPAGNVRISVSGDGTAADVARLRCSLFPPGIAGTDTELRVEGRRSRRHDGSDTFVIGNVVPGDYRVSIQGTPRHRVQPMKSARVKVETGQAADVTIPLKRAGRIQGRAVDGKTGAGLKDVRFNLFAPAEDVNFSGRVSTAADGGFEAYVPAGLPVTVTPDRTPTGYAVAGGPLSALWDTKPVTAPAGAVVKLDDVKLYREGSISGTVVADDRPVADAVVEIHWDSMQQRRPQTLKTDVSGRFHVAKAPPGQPAAVRVRSEGRVNATVVFLPTELVGPVTIPVSPDNTFRIRGKVTDVGGRPVKRAKVVIVSTVQPRKLPQPPVPAANADADAAKVRPYLSMSFPPAEVEAVFTDAAGEFESGALWPGCSYTLTVSADGLATRRLHSIEGLLGKVHEIRALTLRGTSAVISGTVLDADSKPLAGATVINSGDGPKRLSAVTNAAGRFSLSGLYEGPVVLAAHKPGYRWGHVVTRTGGPDAKILLHALTEPPAPLPPPSDEDSRADAELVRLLTEIIKKEESKRPKLVSPPDPWAEAKKDLDGYLQKKAKEPGMSAAHVLLPLAVILAKEDKAKAVRVLREAAAAAKRMSLPANQPGLAFLSGMNMTQGMRVLELIRVANTALDMGAHAEASAWLVEAEGMAGQMPDVQRRQPHEELAAAWVALDPTRTEKLLAALGADAFGRDSAIGSIIGRLLKTDPRKALPWLDRFNKPQAPVASSYRAQVVLRLAKQDPATAIRLADGIGDPVYRGLAFARLATVVHKTDTKLAHSLIDKAAAAVTADSARNQDEPQQRISLAVFLLWQAKKVGYEDLPALVSAALTSRPPLPNHDSLTQAWPSQFIRLAGGVASLDRLTGRALLETAGDWLDPRDPDLDSHQWFTSLALANPAAALRHLDMVRDYFFAKEVLTVLQDRSAVIQSYEFNRLAWMLEPGDQ